MTTQEETWLPIPGFDSRYDVSSDGRVRSWIPWRGEALPRILAPADTPWGYPQVILRDAPNSRKAFRIHQLVMLAFVGPRPEGFVTRHLDGDPANNHVSNLAYGTPRENNLDAVRHGTNSNIRKTHCAQGHAFTEENMWISGKGARLCKTCGNDRQRRKRAARKSRLTKEHA